MLVKVKGLVLRSEDVGERDRLFRVLTAEGKIYVLAKGAISSDGKPRICLLPMLYAELVLYKKGDRYWLREYEVLEDFRKLYRELDRLLLGQYIMSLADRVAVMEQDRSALLSLALNSLYLLAETEKPCAHIKAVTGGIVCSDCLNSGPTLMLPPEADEIREASLLLPLSSTVLAALRYVFTAPAKKAFSFTLPDEEAERLAEVAELYLLSHIGEDFPELKIYKDTVKEAYKQK